MNRLKTPVTFFGSGMIWDTDNDCPLCKFSRDHTFKTDDPRIYKILVDMGVTRSDNFSDKLSEKEFAISTLREEVKELKETNAKLAARVDELSKYESDEDARRRARQEIINQLEDLGVRYNKYFTTEKLKAILAANKK